MELRTAPKVLFLTFNSRKELIAMYTTFIKGNEPMLVQLMNLRYYRFKQSCMISVSLLYKKQTHFLLEYQFYISVDHLLQYCWRKEITLYGRGSSNEKEQQVSRQMLSTNNFKKVWIILQWTAQLTCEHLFLYKSNRFDRVRRSSLEPAFLMDKKLTASLFHETNIVFCVSTGWPQKMKNHQHLIRSTFPFCECNCVKTN